MFKIMTSFLLLFFVALPVAACFGPKLYIGTPAGEEGELLFHLAAIYLHEKTGVESLRFELGNEQTAESVLRQDQVDLVFAQSAIEKKPTLLQIGTELLLVSGPRPTDDLQFTTVPRTLTKLQGLLTSEDLVRLRQQVADGVLPAAAVRQLYRQRSWI